MLLIYIGIFAVMGLVMGALQNLSNNSVRIDGLLIPDVVAMANALDAYFGSLADPFLIEQSFSGIKILYGAFWKVDPPLCFVANALIIATTFQVLRRMFSGEPDLQRAAYFGLCANPYVYMAMTGPNKEVPLLLLTATVFQQIINRPPGWLIKALGASAIAYMFRDGYGVLLAGVTCLCYFTANERRRFIVFAAPILLVSAALFWVVQANLPVIARNKEVVEALANEGSVRDTSIFGLSLSVARGPIGSAIVYCIRVTYNMLTLGMFPEFKTVDGAWFALGGAYWVAGLIIAATSACAIAGSLPKSSDATTPKYRILAPAILFIIGGISLSAYVQPRYLMPLFPVSMPLIVLSRRHGTRIAVAMITICLITICLYAVRGRAFNTGEPAVAHPRFLINS